MKKALLLIVFSLFFTNGFAQTFDFNNIGAKITFNGTGRSTVKFNLGSLKSFTIDTATNSTKGNFITITATEITIEGAEGLILGLTITANQGQEYLQLEITTDANSDVAFELASANTITIPPNSNASVHHFYR